jgi:hypothetical protein
MDFFILDHNLEMGFKYDRNPDFTHANILKLIRTALMCSGVTIESEQYGYFNKLLSTKLPLPKYHYGEEIQYPTYNLATHFQHTQVNIEELESRMAQRCRADLQMFYLQTHSASQRVAAIRFEHCIKYLVSTSGSSTKLTAHEYVLIQDIVQEQKEMKRMWSNSFISTAIMYNVYVMNLQAEKSFAVVSFRSFGKIINTIERCFKLEAAPSKRKQKLFEYYIGRRFATLDRDIQSLHEALFISLRGSPLIKKKLMCSVLCINLLVILVDSLVKIVLS